MKSLLPGRFVAALVLVLTGSYGCTAAQDATAPRATIERAEATGADLITVESDAMIDGRRPSLTLVCRREGPPEMQLDLVRAPASPPPPRGVFAQVQVKGGPEVTIELAWIGGSRWQARSPRQDQLDSDSDDRDNARRLVPILHAFTRERRLTVTPPAIYAPPDKLTWTPATFGPHLAAAQACAFMERPTIDGRPSPDQRKE